MSKLKNKKRFLIGVAAVLLIIIIFSVKMLSYLEEERRQIENIETQIDKEEYEQILYVETGSINEENTVISPVQDTTPSFTSRVIPGKYICLYDAEYQYNIEEEQVEQIEKAKYTIYNLKTGENLRTIDIKEIAETLEPNKINDEIWSGGIRIEKGGNIYLKFLLQDKENRSDQNQWRNLYVNIETGEAVLRKDGLEEARTLEGGDLGDEYGDIFNFGVLSRDRIGLVKANGFKPYYSERYGREIDGLYVTDWGYGVVQIELQKKDLPENNEKLYGEFPELKNYEGKPEDILVFYIKDYPSAEEILEMFLEEGEEISFEGCVLSAEWSKDEQAHEIHSFEEYDEWYKW